MTGPMKPGLPPERVRPGFWFRPRRFGWGARPATWQGWLAVLVMLVCAVLLARLAQQRGAVWLALLVPLLVGFITLAWIKTDGEWRWRWGGRD